MKNLHKWGDGLIMVIVFLFQITAVFGCTMWLTDLFCPNEGTKWVFRVWGTIFCIPWAHQIAETVYVMRRAIHTTNEDEDTEVQ